MNSTQPAFAALFPLVIVAGLLLSPTPALAQCTNCTTTTVGTDVVHTFTSGSGTFTPPAGINNVQYLVVGGGAGGGGLFNGSNLGGAGGGGAGGYQAGAAFAVTPSQVYNITVGAGGAAGVGNTSQGGTGGNSVFSTITANGGGGGASAGVNNDGVNGASGGGARISGNNGGTGIAGQGNAGGNGNNAAGGGGGSAAAGANGGGTVGGAGGAGTSNNITGAAVTYATGGTGGNYDGTRAAGAPGAANTGNGGGGASGNNGGGAFNGGAGGSGIVVIRYTPPPHYYSRNSGTWTGNNRWSLVGCGGASAGGAEPGPGDQVTICNGDTIQLNTSIGGAGLVSMTIQAGGELQMANNNVARSLTVAGNIDNDGTLIIPTNRNTTSSLIIGGNLTNNGVFDMFTDANSLVDVTFNGSASQILTGTSADSNFHNLTLNNPNGLELTGAHNAIVNTTLTLTSGLLTTNANVVHVVSGNAVAGAGATTFVAGNLRKRFTAGAVVNRVYEVGTVSGGVLYAPVIVQFGNVTGAGDFTVSTTAGDHPDIANSTLDPNLSINRYWTLTNDSTTFTADVNNGAWFIFNDPQDHDAGTDFNEFYVGHYNGAWTEITPTVRAANGVIIAGAEFTMAAFPGDYQIAQRASTPTCATGLASGLPGEYFNNMTLAGTATGTRIDGPVDFNWATGDPGVTGIGVDQFSVRWDGILRATATGNHQFQTVSDDGVRLYVNNTLVIDNWTDHAATTDTSGNVALTAGQLYFIRLEFYENGGQAEIRLRWQQPGDPGFSPIPAGPTPALGAGLYYCPPVIPGLTANYMMDETAWNGSADEVQDSSTGGLHGTAAGGATTAGTNPARPGSPGTCRYGVFDGNDDYIQVNNLSTFLNGTASLAFWIRTTQTGNDLGWQAPGVTGVELGGGADDIFWGWLDAAGNIGISVANTFTTKSTIPINDGTWRHIVLTRDHVAGEYKIYIDGGLNANGAIATGLIGTGFSSIGRIEDTGGTPEYFDGELDEVRIYDNVLSDAQVVTVMNETHPCTAAPDHIRIEHDGEGLTCAPEQVTVRACMDATCSTEYIDSVTTTLSPAGWVGSDTITFSGGSTTAQLRRTTVGAVTLDATATSPAPTNVTRCFNGLTETCTLNFVDSGFIFDVPTQTACRTSAAVTITAVKTADNGQTCAPAFSGARSVGFWSTYVDPATGMEAVSVNGAPVGTASPGTGINLNFDANAQATFTVAYPDAGLMQLNARHEGSGVEAGLVMTGSDQFVSVPVGLAVYAATNCPAGNATCPVFGIAGAAFSLNVKAACWVSDGDTDLSDNPETPNFRLTGIPMTHALIAPVGGAPGSLGNGSFDFIAADDGIHTFNQTVSEVGVFTFTAAPAANSYFGQTIPAATSPNIGRFRPARYNVTFSDIISACTSTPPGFTYSRQPFTGSMTIEAQNSTGNLTSNFRDGFDTLNPAVELIFENDQTNAAYDSEAVNFLAGQNFSDAPTGIASIGLQFTWNMPMQAAVDTTVQLTGSNDEVNVVAGAPTPVDIGASEIRFGRMFLENTFGSELLPLTLPLYAEYYNGTEFIRNTDDSCTTYDANALTFSNPNPGGFGVTDNDATGTLDQGGYGTIDPVIQISSNGQQPGSICVAHTVPIYLRFNWAANPGLSCIDPDGDPAAKATFGIFDGSGRQIYIREVY